MAAIIPAGPAAPTQVIGPGAPAADPSALPASANQNVSASLAEADAKAAQQNDASAGPYASISKVSAAQPASEPGVISSSTIADSVVPKNNNLLETLSQKGTFVGSDGALRYSDNSLVPAPVSAESSGDNMWKDSSGNTYGAPPQYINENDAESQNMNNLVASMKESLDTNTKSQIDTIEQQHALLTQQQQDANSRAAASRGAALLGAGTSQYAPFSASGTMLAETSFGLSKIAALDAQESSQLAAARKAQSDGDMQLMDKALGQVQAIRTQKQAAAQKIIDYQQTQLQKAGETQIQASRDSAVADLVAQGVSDPGTILRYLNENPNAGPSGGDFTSAEVAATLKNIASTTGAAGIKGLTGDVGNFYALKQAGGLPSSILALPEAKQLSAYIAMVNQAKKGIVGTTGTSPTASAIVGASVPAVAMNGDGNPDPHTQAAFLEALPGGETGQTATLIRGLADYSISPTAFATRQYKGVAGMTQSDAIALAKQYDPTYDEKQYATRQAMQKNITTGPYSQSVAAANTLIKHLGILSDAGEKLPGQASFLPGVFNKEANFMSSTVLGQGNVNRFNTEVSAVGSEAAKVYKGVGAPAESEIRDWQDKATSNMSPDQRKQTIGAILDLMGGKLSTLVENYQKTMGKPGDFQILTSQSAAVLKKLGFDPGAYDPTYKENTDVGTSHTIDDFLASGPSVAPVSSAPVNWGAAAVH